LITSETQINDATTAALEAFVALCDGDTQKLASIRAMIEAQKAELEREQAQIKQQFASARNRSERRAAVDHAEQLAQKADAIRSDLLKVDEELEVLTKARENAISRASSRLILPYGDATGYCACYSRKLQRLAVIASQIAAQQAIYAANAAALAAARATIHRYYRYAGGAVITVLIFLFVIFGTGGAGVNAAIVAGVVLVIALLALFLYLLSLRLAMSAALRQQALLMLMYYRLQQIPTCVKAPDDEDDDDWYQYFFDWLEHPKTISGG
jgi:hypothetical protein